MPITRASQIPKLWQVFLVKNQAILKEYPVQALDQDSAIRAARNQATLDNFDHLDGHHSWAARVTADKVLVP